MKPQANDTAANRRAGKARNGKQPPRRVYSLEYKLQVLEQCRTKGAAVAEVARRHNMNNNVIFRWRQEGRAGNMSASCCGDAGRGE
jgi:transposase-like protein